MWSLVAATCNENSTQISSYATNIVARSRNIVGFYGTVFLYVDCDVHEVLYKCVGHILCCSVALAGLHLHAECFRWKRMLPTMPQK